MARERAGGICTRAARGARVFIKYAEKREKRKNESGEHVGNRSDECMGNRSGEYTGNRAGEQTEWLDRQSRESARGEMVET